MFTLALAIHLVTGDVPCLTSLRLQACLLWNLTRAGVVDGAREVGPGKHDTYLGSSQEDGDRTTCGDLRDTYRTSCRC